MLTIEQTINEIKLLDSEMGKYASVRQMAEMIISDEAKTTAEYDFMWSNLNYFWNSHKKGV